MNTSFASLTHKMQRAAVSKMVDVLFSHMEMTGKRPSAR